MLMMLKPYDRGRCYAQSFSSRFPALKVSVIHVFPSAIMLRVLEVNQGLNKVLRYNSREIFIGKADDSFI